MQAQEHMFGITLPAAFPADQFSRRDGVLTIPEGLELQEPVLIHCRGDHALQVRVQKNARAEIVTVTGPEITIPLRVSHSAMVEEGASIEWRMITLASAGVTHDLRSDVSGAHASSSIDWIFYARGEEKYTFSMRNVFHGRDGGGEITVRGVAEHKAHVRCDGMIAIGEGGGGTDTYLTQRMLMLDPSARIDAVPALEIKTNDVKASHSATVSRVSPDDLFYFASRGIAEQEARKMFVEGFLGDLVQHIADAATRDEVLALLERKYQGA